MRQWTGRGGARAGWRRIAVGAAAGAALLLTAATPAFTVPSGSGSRSSSGSGSGSGSGSKERDVQLVYCLDTAHRADLVAAGLRLGLLEPDTSTAASVTPTADGAAAMTPETWADRHRDDFGRACAALMGAAADSPGAGGEAKKDDGWLTTFLAALPALVLGALLTLGGQASERLSTERRRIGQQLDASTAAYRAAAREYLRAYEDDAQADHTAVVTAREALDSALAQVDAPGARRSRARFLAETLPLAGPLPEFVDGERLGTDARGQQARDTRRSVDEALGGVSDLNRRALQWRWRTVRERLSRTDRGAAV
ncbi:hypothetical protein [Streptomyces sp. NPDC090022]|uniref:hypothetical protein n=1 Tax=Streptomyces sp. NPDC090022 TaxID=3365920 RepID=UPI00380F6BA4